MKKIFLLFLIIVPCIFALSCDSGGGGDDDVAPFIQNLTILADPGDYVETTSFSVGDTIYVAFEAYDENKDIKSAIATFYDATTFDFRGELELALPKQTDKGMVYLLVFIPGAEDIGTNKLYLYIRDKAGKDSNVLSKNITVHWLRFYTMRPLNRGLF